MAVRSVLVVLLVLGLALISVQCINKEDNSYLILSPKGFWPGRTLTLKVTILKAKGPVNITAALKSGYYNQPTKLITSKTGIYTAGTTGDLNIEVPSGLSTSSYQLTINGTGGLSFYNESYITFHPKGMSIYVQMDKGIYKPGQTVHMRIFALLPSLKSYTGKMTVDILDPNSNKMAHWPDIQVENGFIKKDLTLSKQPVMGTWKVVVKANGEKSTKPFEVKEYVLPKFDVAVVLPPYVLQKDNSIMIKVSSKYTYGKSVKGKVQINGYFNSYWRKKTDCFTKYPKIDGSVSLEISKDDIKKCFGNSYKHWHYDDDQLYRGWYSLIVNATVTEDLTGKHYSGQANVKFYNSDVKLHFPSFNPRNFKPGLEFVTMLKVTQPNGEQCNPTKLKTVKVTFKTKYNWTGPEVIDDYTPSDDGIILIKKKIPLNAPIVHLEAEYRVNPKHKQTTSFTAYKFNSPTASFLQLSTTTSSVKSGDRIDCQVISNFAITSYTYVVVARGKIRQIKTTKITNSGNTFTFSVTTSSVMAPTAQIVVYTIRNNGEVVVDSLSVTIENPFENEVSLKYSRASSGPGDQISLVAKATPGSHVAFLVVDKSVLLMKKDNDLSRDGILSDLRSYSSGSNWYPWWEWDWFGRVGRRRRSIIMPFPTSGSDAMSVFKNSGLIIFSDCLVYQEMSHHNYLLESGTVAFANSDRTLLMKNSAGRPSGSQPSLAPVTKVRTLFPETWIWVDVNASSTGEAEISTSVPDTITSWVASAFAISPQTGFGIGAIKPQLKVFQPFFVSLDLPYSVVRGEEVAIKALVFNYLEQPQEVTITFKASKDWKVINEVSTVRGDYEQEAVDIQEKLTIPAGEGKAVAFPIKPQTLGNIPLTVQAQSSVAADAVKRTILVEPEGVPSSYSYSVLLDLNTTSSFTKTLELALPKSVVSGSATAKVSVIGDILGSSFSNLDNLLRMPYGCGEQNMVNFAPNIFVLKYLTAVNQVTPKIKTKADTYMVQGYQREQTYKHRDGSYSAFGERDKQGSMWLTAFVVKSFAQARRYIYVDPDSLDLSLEFMARKQNGDGSFPVVGKVHSSYLKGGNNGIFSLTAYVVVALAEAESSNKVVMLAKQEGIKYLENNLDDVILKKDVYALALSAYALRLVNSRYSEKARLALLRNAIRKDGMVHWSNAKQDSDQSATYRPYYRPKSADVEITAYALLTFSLNKDISNGLPVVRWLSVQRNSLGGYASTQDTVLGIQAMSEFAALIYSSSQAFDVKLTQSADTSFSKSFSVNTANSMVLQQVLITNVSGTLTIAANGRGIGMLQVGVTYHVDKAPDDSAFDFVIEILKEGRYEIQTKSCATWSGDGDTSDMAVMELGVVSGFSPSQDSIEKMLNDKSLAVKRVDKEDKKLVVYFDQINKDKPTCIQMVYERTHAVGKGQPVPAVVYDYYNPEYRAEALYSSDKLSKESVCRVCPICLNCKHLLDPNPDKTTSFGVKLSCSLALTLLAVKLAVLVPH